MIHRFILHNGQIREASEKVLSPGQVGLLSGWGVFSTLRVADGVLFAWERHWARMLRDAAALHVPLTADPAEVRQDLLRLVEANGARNSTLRVAVLRNGGGMWAGPDTGSPGDLIALTADSKHWGDGARLCYTKHARYAAGPFAGAKILSWAMNLTWLEEAQQKGFDETILLNEHGEVAECTSANIFMAMGDQVFTPPLSSGCLPGITRELLVSELRAPGVTLREQRILPEEIETADEVFITSTTRDLLPVFEIEGRKLVRRSDAREALQRVFSAYLRAYVADHRQMQQPVGN